MEINHTANLPSDENDETLVQRSAYDQEAFTKLYMRHVNRVYTYFLSRAGNVPDAQDLTAQTFVAVIEGLATYQNQQKFQSWLMAIAYHKLMDHFRSQRQLVALEEVEEFIPDPEKLDVSVDLQIDLNCAFSMLRNLSENQAEALALSIFGDLGAAEIGEILNKSESAVRMLIFRAIRNLKQHFVLCNMEKDE